MAGTEGPVVDGRTRGPQDDQDQMFARYFERRSLRCPTLGRTRTTTQVCLKHVF